MCAGPLKPKAPPPPAPIIIEQPAPPPAPTAPTPVGNNSGGDRTIIKEVAATPVPQEQDPAIAETRNRERRRRLLRAEANNTVITGGEGLTAPAETGKKQLFGQ